MFIVQVKSSPRAPEEHNVPRALNLHSAPSGAGPRIASGSAKHAAPSEQQTWRQLNTLCGKPTERISQLAFFVVSALLFVVSAAATIMWSASMSTMGEMPMPGGWSMAMVWMQMPGQTWLGTAATFLGMWVVMMVAMMLPSLVPMLWRYRDAVMRTREVRLGLLTAVVGVAYFSVWTFFGVLAFLFGVALTTLEMHEPALARAVPMVVSLVVVMAGAFQFTQWKARNLAGCREIPRSGCNLPDDTGTALRHGLRLGIQCICCCAGIMVILLVVGVMDLSAMGVVAAAMTIERVAPAGVRVARAIGIVIIVTGLFLIAQATLFT